MVFIKESIKMNRMVMRSFMKFAVYQERQTLNKYLLKKKPKYIENK
jgi:hypothetical protein